MDYSWTKTWEWGEGNEWDTEDDAIAGGPTTEPLDYLLEGGKYHYDPEQKFDKCEYGYMKIECLAEIKLGFFSSVSFIIALVIVGVVYFVMEKKKKK